MTGPKLEVATLDLTIARFHSLDILRGLAALCVVFWHWQHFFYEGSALGPFIPTDQPGFRYLSLLYARGWLAVDLFFCLSGFIFYWLYSQRIVDRTITPSRFALLRLSRLYPLHVVTLVLVLIGQWWLTSAGSRPFVYAHNDGYHFLLNLAFASNWGFERGFSFNAPIWSVSVEVLLYAIFFCVCRWLPIRGLALVILALIGLLVVQRFNLFLGRGVGSFFLGGCAFLVYIRVRRSSCVAILTWTVIGTTMLFWTIAIVIAVNPQLSAAISLRDTTLLAKFDDALQAMLATWPVVVLFPLTILALTLFETLRGSFARRFSWIGNISYSSYLLHFPLQFIFHAVALRWTTGNMIFYEPWVMVLFFTILIGLSMLSFHFFEMPVQNYLRRFEMNSVAKW